MALSLPRSRRGTSLRPTPWSCAPLGPPAAAPTPAAFEGFWYPALIKGFIPRTQAPPRTVPLQPGFAAAAAAPPAATGMETIFRPDTTIWDGRFANNGWLQELPKPLTSLTWDNAAMISPRTAEARHLSKGDMVELSYRGRTLAAPILIAPGHPDDAVTLTLGYGRSRAGRVGTSTGFNAYALRTSDTPWFGSGLEIRKTHGSYNLVTAQVQIRTEGRDLVHAGTIAEYRQKPGKPAFMETEEKEEGPLPSLYPQMWPSDRQGIGGIQGPTPRGLG